MRRPNTHNRRAWSATFRWLKDNGFGRFRTQEVQRGKQYHDRRRNIRVEVVLDRRVPERLIITDVDGHGDLEQLDLIDRPYEEYYAEPVRVPNFVAPILPSEAYVLHYGNRYTDAHTIMYHLRQIYNAPTQFERMASFNYIFNQPHFTGRDGTYARKYQFPGRFKQYYLNLVNRKQDYHRCFSTPPTHCHSVTSCILIPKNLLTNHHIKTRK